MVSDVPIKRERDAEVARQAILDAAETIFAQNGFDGARVDAIAAAAGYNKSLIFHYFGDKLGLYREIVLRSREQFQGQLEPILTSFMQNAATQLDRKTVEAFLKMLIKWNISRLVNNPHMVRMLAWEAAEGWHTFTSFRRKPEENGTGRAIVDFVRRAQKADLIRVDLDPLLLLFNIRSLCMYHVLSLPLLQQMMESTEGRVLAVEHTQEQIIKLILHGALAPAVDCISNGEKKHD